MKNESIAVLSIPRKIGYGLGDFGAQFVYSTISLYLMYFFTDVALIGATAAGLILMVARIWDAFLDPVIGYVADHTHTRWGQMRPYLLFFSVPLGISFFLLMLTPDGSADTKVLYYQIVSIIVWTLFSLVTVPYCAMLPNLTLDAEERASIGGVTKFFTIVALIVIGAMTRPFVSSFGNEKTGFMYLGALYGMLVIIFSLVPFFAVKERIQTKKNEDYRISELFKLLAQNRPFIILSVVGLIVFMVFTITGAMINYFFKYNLKDEKFIPIAYTCIFVIAACAMPLWVYLSRRIGKKMVYMLSMAIYGFVFLLLFFINAIDMIILVPMFILSGIGFSGLNLSIISLTPDTVEYGEWKTGRRTEGIQYGVGAFVTKLAASLASVIVGSGLDFFGYVANAVQSAQSLFGIRILISIVPFGLLVVGCIVLYFYPITSQMHHEICTEIADRHGVACEESR